MINKEVVITKAENLTLTAFIEANKVQDILGYPDDPEKTFKTGDIYKAKVINLQPNIGAAFLSLIPGVKAFMEIRGSSPVKPEQEIIVEIVKEAFGEKEMAVSPFYSLSGKYLVIKNASPSVSVSRKIAGERRTELMELGNGLIKGFPDISLIVRTNAAGAGNEEIVSEFESLLSDISDLRKKASYSVPYIKLYSAPEPYMDYIRDLKEKPDRIVTDDPSIYEALRDHFKGDEELYSLIDLYSSESISLLKVSRLEAALDEIKKRTVHLKSGGTLIIDRTEACHVIDVNSGKNTDKLTRKELILKTNLEAVKEAARQIRLRNLGGMILFDLINMIERSDRNKVIAELKNEAFKDRLKCEFIDLTGLGIAELTREKKNLPLSLPLEGC